MLKIKIGLKLGCENYRFMDVKLRFVGFLRCIIKNNFLIIYICFLIDFLEILEYV